MLQNDKKSIDHYTTLSDTRHQKSKRTHTPVSFDLSRFLIFFCPSFPACNYLWDLDPCPAARPTRSRIRLAAQRTATTDSSRIEIQSSAYPPTPRWQSFLLCPRSATPPRKTKLVSIIASHSFQSLHSLADDIDNKLQLTSADLLAPTTKRSRFQLASEAASCRSLLAAMSFNGQAKRTLHF